MSIQQDLFTDLKTQLQARITQGYIKTWQFNRKNIIWTVDQFPVAICYPARINIETYVAVPKQKMIEMVFMVSGKVTNTDPNTLELKIQEMDEKLKNACEFSLQLTNGATITNIGVSQFNWINDTIGETVFEVIVTSNRFTSGSR